jgi:hypothetical protein
VCPDCGDVWMDAYSSARFNELEVKPSTLVHGADNRVQLDFSLDRMMPPGSRIQIHFDAEKLNVPNGETTVLGRNRAWFEPAAKWNDELSGLVLTSARSIPAHAHVSIYVVTSNSDKARGSSGLEVKVSSRSDFFPSLDGQSWARAGPLKSASFLPRVVGSPLSTPSSSTKLRKIVMMDVTVLGSVFISSIDLHLPSMLMSTPPLSFQEWNLTASTRPCNETWCNSTCNQNCIITAVAYSDVMICEYQCYVDFVNKPQTLDIYYKEGSHASAKRNLTEWRLLGRVAIQNLVRLDNSSLRLHLSDLTSQFSEEGAQQVGMQMQDPAGLPGFTPVQTWLGARPSWVNNSARYMSSTLGSGVNLRKVFNLSDTGLWHSGNGTETWSEAGCPHLPTCPMHWPFNKNQWIAFDTGVCYTLSAFRTTFPNYTRVPIYNFGGIKRTNINEDDWSKAHFRYFELQYSTARLEGPWRVALSGEAQAGLSTQHFPFQPITARYWRLLLKDNFDFGYFALQSIEFFGFASPWCSDSSWCHASQQCRTTQNDLISVRYNQDASLHQYALALEAGVHSFMLRASHGLPVSDSDGRRSDVDKSDSTLMLHHAAEIDRICSGPTCAKNDPVRIKMERTLPIATSPIGPIKHLSLPTSSKLCHAQFRLVVKEMINLTTGPGDDSGRYICLDQFALFQQIDPQWIAHNISLAQIVVGASSQREGYLAETAFNGGFAPGDSNSSNSATFCWSSTEISKSKEWISVAFPHSICVAGYALLDHGAQFSFSAWELQGSDNGRNWTTIDRRRQEISTHRHWRKFALAQSRPTNYLFSNGRTYGYAPPSVSTSTTDAVGSTGNYGESPCLHRVDDDQHWALEQLFGGGGVHDVAHFVIAQEHFLALARSRTSAGPDGVSEVMRWDGQAFVPDHTLPIGWCTSVAYFTQNAAHYLVVSDHGRDAPYMSSEVSVLKYQGAADGWAKIQRISQSPTSSIHVVKPYSAAGILYLIVALSAYSSDCQGAFSCMQSAVFQCDAGNRTQDLRFHTSGYLVADALRSQRCGWIVAPPNANSVTLTFLQLDTVSCCRQIKVYSCTDASCANKTMLENLTHSGTLGTLSSSTGVLALEYAAFVPKVYVVCTGSCENTEACTSAQGSGSGTITDGPGNYQNSWTCTWEISLDQAFVGTSLSFELSEFDTEENHDTLSISTCITPACTSVNSQFSGPAVPSSIFTSTSGRLRVSFSSDGNGTRAGFNGTWTLRTSPPTSGTFFEAHFDSTLAVSGPGALITYMWKDQVVADDHCRNETDCRQFEMVSGGNHTMRFDGVDLIALDLEPFESAHNPGEHYVAVATVPSSPSGTSLHSLVYKLSASGLEEWQRLAGPPALRCKHIEKDGLDYLFMASYAGNTSVYRWDANADTGITRYGFSMAGQLPVSRVLNLETFEAEGALFLGVTASNGTEYVPNATMMSQSTVVNVLRWMDALQWHGSFEYTDAFMPFASFPIRQLREATLLSSRNRTYVATLQSDRSLPPGSTIRIMRITGVEQSEQHVEIFGQDAPAFGGRGSWLQASATLKLTTTRWIDSNNQISFGFSIAKGHKPRSALYAQISCSGSVTILTEDMEVFGNGWPAQTGRLRQDCSKGHTAIDGWPCTACPPGTYKDTIGSAQCTPCAVGTSSPLTARTLACDDLCERGRYATGGNSVCDLCPAHTFTANQGSNLTNCTCNFGYTGPDGKACASCVAGTFKYTNGSAACTRCVAGKYSTQLAKIFEDTCTLCPVYSFSMPGANNITNCTCNVGYTGE